MNAPAIVARYLARLGDAIRSLEQEPIPAALDLLEGARRDGRTVFVFGNGGSATTAAHIACDLAKNTRSGGRPGLRMICLAIDAGTLSAYANDEGYDATFAQPLRTLAQPGDVAIALSASGTSPNVVAAVEAARELGVHTIALSGPDGGDLPRLADVCLHAASPQIEQIEDVHLVINHLLTVLLRGTELGSG